MRKKKNHQATTQVWNAVFDFVVHWFWQTDDGGWAEYDQKSTDNLEKGFQNSDAKIKVDNQRY